MKRLLLILVILCLGCSAVSAQTTYTWIGATGGSWAVSTNWSPTRTTPATNDIIVFNSGTALSITSVPTQTIRSLTVTNNSNITLSGATGALTLSINGPPAAANLQIDAGSTLQLTSAGTTLTLNFITTGGQLGSIDGTLQLNTKGLFNTANAVVTVNSGGVITNNCQTSGITPLTSTAATLVFAAGSVYSHITNIQVGVPTATYNINSTAVFSAGTSTINNMTQTFGNVTVNSAGTLTLFSGSPTIAGVLTLTAGVLAAGSNTLTLTGTMAATGTGTITASGTVSIGGSGGDYGTLRFTGATTLTTFTMNRGGAGTVGINQPVTVSSALNLSNGVINSNGNLISLTNGAAASLTNTGGTASYINGALQRTLAANLGSATLLFPIGKTDCQSLTFNGLSTTSSASMAVIKVEAFDASSGGTFDPSLSGLNTDNYWSATVTANAASLSTPGTVSLSDATPALSASNAIATCSTLAGSYTSLGGTVSAPQITGSIAAPASLGYFVIGTQNNTPLCGTYTIGPTGTFASVSEAVNSLNTRPVTCSVIFELQSAYTAVNEHFPVSINYSGSAALTAVFRPEAGAGTLVTSGDPGSGNALISFNGADYVTFDGRPGGTGSTVSWTIRNSRTASTVGPAIQLGNGATHDALSYVRIESQNSAGTSGTVYISSYPLWAAANTNISISNCDITKYTSGSVTHINAIYAYGETACPNSYISILNNNIHSFTPGLSSEATGVTVTGTGLNTDYGDHWTIRGNSFYLDCAEQQLYRYTVINLIPGTGSSGNVIAGNYIGGGAPLCAGSTWTSAVSGAGNTIQTFEGIYVTAGSTNVDSNTVQNISLTGTGGTSFGAIHLANCSSSGTYSVSYNLVGSNSSCNSVQNAGQWKDVGIWLDNTCGGITTAYNTIANMTVSNAVNAAATMTGIYSDCGSNTITHNTIYNLTAATATATAQLYIAHDASIAGIADKSVYSGTTQTISNNTVYNLKSTYAGTSSNKIYGIYMAPGVAGKTHVYNANLVFGIDAPNASTNAKITGIGAVGSSATSAETTVISNNMIGLGYRMDGTSITSGAELTGILDNTSGYTSGANTTFVNVYHNSVYIGGSGVTGTTNNTYAFRRNNTNSSPKNTEDIRDNIFVNNRSNSSGSKIHYSVYLDNTSTVTCNYNDCYGGGTGYKLGSAAATDYAALSNWQGLGFDANGIAADPLFYSTVFPADLHVQGGSPVIAAGTSLGVTSDYDAENFASADMGADAYNAAYTLPAVSISTCAGVITAPLPVELLSFSGTLENKTALLHWITATETNCDHYTVQRSTDAAHFTDAGTLRGAGNSSTTLYYSFRDDLRNILSGQPQTLYYRLMQTDYDGQSTYSDIISLQSGTNGTYTVDAYPNPAETLLNIRISGAHAQRCTYSITDLAGRVLPLKQAAFDADAQLMQIDVSELKEGMYFITLVLTGDDARTENVLRKILKK